MTKIEEYYLLVCTAREGSMAVGTLVYDHRHAPGWTLCSF